MTSPPGGRCLALAYAMPRIGAVRSPSLARPALRRKALRRLAERLPNARELGQTSLIFLVHQTITAEQISDWLCISRAFGIQKLLAKHIFRKVGVFALIFAT